jgi:ArsR family transcriptional regulator, zinc-responsive transcriptional repressor
MAKADASTDELDLEQLSTLFRLLSDKTRLNIVMLLSHGEKNVSALCKTLRLAQPTVSHHLGLLRASNVIANHRRGKKVFYGLNGVINHRLDSGIELSLDNFKITLCPNAKLKNP